MHDQHVRDQGSRDGAVVEHLPPTQASHQCGPGSIPGLGVICGLSLLLVLVFAPRGFFPWYSGFPLSSKTNISKFQFDRDYCQTLYHEPLSREIAQALPVFLTLNKLSMLPNTATVISIECLVYTVCVCQIQQFKQFQLLFGFGCESCLSEYDMFRSFY